MISLCEKRKRNGREIPAHFVLRPIMSEETIAEPTKMFQSHIPGWITFSDGDTIVSIKIDAIENIISNKGLYWDDKTEAPATTKILENRWYSLFCREPKIKETIIHTAPESCIKPYVKIILASGEYHYIKMDNSTYAINLHAEILDWIAEWRNENRPLMT